MVIKSPHNSATSLSSSGQQYRPTIPVEAFSAGQESSNDLEGDLGSVASSLESVKIKIRKQMDSALASRYAPADVKDAVDAILSVNLSTLEQAQSQSDTLFSKLLKSTGSGTSVARVEGALIYEGVTYAQAMCAVSGDNHSTLPVSLSITTYPNPVVVTNAVSCTVTSIDLEVLEFRWRDNASNNSNWSKPNDFTFPSLSNHNYELAIRVRIPKNTPYQALPVWELQYISNTESYLDSNLKPGSWISIAAFGSDVFIDSEAWDAIPGDTLDVRRFVTNQGPGDPGLLEGVIADSIIQAPGIQTGSDSRYYETEVRFLLKFSSDTSGNYLFFRLQPTDYASSYKYRMVNYTSLLNTPWTSVLG